LVFGVRETLTPYKQELFVKESQGFFLKKNCLLFNPFLGRLIAPGGGVFISGDYVPELVCAP
jgi:hypothetical protein